MAETSIYTLPGHPATAGLRSFDFRRALRGLRYPGRYYECATRVAAELVQHASGKADIQLPRLEMVIDRPIFTWLPGYIEQYWQAPVLLLEYYEYKTFNVFRFSARHGSVNCRIRPLHPVFLFRPIRTCRKTCSLPVLYTERFCAESAISWS